MAAFALWLEGEFFVYSRSSTFVITRYKSIHKTADNESEPRHVKLYLKLTPITNRCAYSSQNKSISNYDASTLVSHFCVLPIHRDSTTHMWFTWAPLFTFDATCITMKITAFALRHGIWLHLCITCSLKEHILDFRRPINKIKLIYLTEILPLFSLEIHSSFLLHSVSVHRMLEI